MHAGPCDTLLIQPPLESMSDGWLALLLLLLMMLFRLPTRYHAFDNSKKDGEENTQVPELMEKVEELITDNQGQTMFVCLFVCLFVLSFRFDRNPFGFVHPNLLGLVLFVCLCVFVVMMTI